MKIGIIGLGVVGEAVKHGLERIGHTVRGFDVKHPGTGLQQLMDAQLIFLSLPTPCNAKTGVCDTSIVEKVAQEIEGMGFKGLIVVKSTVTPGTTDKLAERHPNLRFAFCPEFLRERAAYTDFVENHDVCVIGAYNDDDYELIKEAHGNLPKAFANVRPIEAEFSKYFSNVYNAMRIIFANSFYDVATKAGADYAKIKRAMVLRSNIEDAYLDCNENFRGFGGVCLPKDTTAFAAYVRSTGHDIGLFDLIVNENKKFKTTVFNGMRPA
jgi:UDPglucose 6-dehydrogenase